MKPGLEAVNRDTSLTRSHIPDAVRQGVNLIGHVSGNLGLGVYARQALAYFKELGVPVATFDLDPGLGRGRQEAYLGQQPKALHITELPYEINLFVLPPPAIDWLVNDHGPALKVDSRFNVAIVFWETPVIPPEWRAALGAIDVILATSPFIYSAFALSCPGPALINADIPLPELNPARRSRRDFGLPERGTLFLTSFEPHSDPVRKNIEGAIHAFLKGAGEVQDAYLVIKVNNADAANSRQMTASVEALAAGNPRIIFLMRNLPYAEVIALYSVCDVYVSLHRAEGFGLCPFEMMSLGKPVVATGWSGNMTYMDATSACLVGYDLKPVRGALGVYQGQSNSDAAVWAEPDIEEAAAWIRMLATQADERQRFGSRARAGIDRYNARARARDFWLEAEELFRQRQLLGLRRRSAAPLAAAAPAPAAAPAAAAKPPDEPVSPWLPKWRLLPREQEWAAECIAGWGADVPRVGVAVIASDRRGSDASVDSLRQQWLAPQAIRVVDGGTDGAALLARVNATLAGSGADWVGVMDAGDQLAADALFRVAVAARLHPQWQIIYTDEDNINVDGKHLNPHSKPDFNLDYLRSLPYVGGLMLIRRDLFDTLGGFNPASEGAEDYDLLLRAWEHLQARGGGDAAIGHVPEVLYHRLQGSGHTQKNIGEILAAGQSVLEGHFARLGLPAKVERGPFAPALRVRWALPAQRPMVSIVIPTRDQLPLLRRCIESVIEKTSYQAYEILIVDNDSQAADACEYLAALEAREAELGGRLRVIRHPGAFNFSAMNNAAARAARGDYLLLLNNDTAALHEDWLDEMMGHAVRPDVGIVGAKLLFPDGKLQHAGVILGMKGPAEHPFIGHVGEDRGYFGRAQLTQDMSAVTGACLLVRKSVYAQLGGLDETDFKVSYNDIDLCLKVRDAGLRIVFTPFALLMHEGSASQRGQVETKPDEAKARRFAAEKDAMYRKWLPQLAFDPAHNRHLSLATTEFLYDDQPIVSWDPAWRPRPRLLVHPADREGCGEYRIIAPMRALNRAGLTQGWETMRLFEPAEMERINPDSLVVQRQMEWPQIEALERHGKYTKAFRVFELDDLITNLPVKSVHKAHIHKDIAKRFRKAASLCNRLVVATEPLAKAYAGYADEVVVCPNYLEAARWGHLVPARAERERPRVGWAGGIGHSGDLELIVDLVHETAKEFDWVFFGMCPEVLRPVVKEFHIGIPLNLYAAKLASLDLDLAVAPLEDNPFNEAKSHLRLLEYGVLGYPVICSDMTPYQGDFPVTRVANRFRDWNRALREALSDRKALRAQADALRAKVKQDWMMEDHLDVWMKAWTA